MDIKDKLLSGYAYRGTPTEDRSGVIVNTGIGGAKLLIDALREVGFPDFAIAELIQVFVEGQWVNLSQVTTKLIKMKIKFKKLCPDAVTPSYAKDGDAGLDLTVVSIEHRNEYIQYSFGIAVEIPKHFFGLMIPRSSITKLNLMMKNSVGVIDSGYRGELLMRCKKVNFEDGTAENVYSVGDKAAQLIILPCPQIELTEVDTLEESERGQGGFGHTDKK